MTPESAMTRITLGPVVELAVLNVTNRPAPSVPVTTVAIAPNGPISRARLRSDFASVVLMDNGIMGHNRINCPP